LLHQHSLLQPCRPLTVPVTYHHRLKLRPDLAAHRVAKGGVWGPACLLLLHLLTHRPLLTDLLPRVDGPDTHLMLTQASSIPAALLVAAGSSSHLSASGVLQLQDQDRRLLEMMAVMRLLSRTPAMKVLLLPARQQAAAVSMAVQQMATASSSNRQTVPSWPCLSWLHRAYHMSTGSISR
jgi:hypothetical protein